MRDDAPVRAVGYVLVAAGGVCWATNGIASSLIFQTGLVAPTDLAALRIYGAAAILGLGVVTLLPRLSRGALIRLAAFGVLGVNMPQALYYQAISRISVPIALVIVYSAPVLVTAFERVVRRERLPRTVYLSIVVAIAGVIGAVVGGTGGIGALSAAGLLLAVATMVGYSIQILLAGIQPRELSPLRRIGAAMVFGSIFWLVVAPLWTMPWDVMGTQAPLGPRIDGTAAIGLLVLYVTVMGTVVPYTMLVEGTPRIGPGAAAVTGMIEPITAAFLAWIVLGQSLTWIQIVSVAVALGGVTAAETLRTRARVRDAAAESEEVFAA